MTRLEEVVQRLGSRPALIRMANAGDYFGDNAPYRIEEGVAIINVFGPLLNEKCDCGGCTFYGDVQDQLKIASADPSVKGILLNINSPGGSTDNSFETANLIASLEKPCYAVAGTMAYSAAYLLASQADRVYCVETSGGVGSIGVYCLHMDLSGMLKKIGVVPTFISAGEGKTDGNPFEPLSDSARADLQAEIDRLYGEFVGAVAMGRGLNPTAIVKMGARCIEGSAAAIAAGLADAPGDMETAWVDLCTEIQRPKMPLIPGMAAQGSAASAAEVREKQRMDEVETLVPAEAKQPTAAEIEALVQAAREGGSAEASAIVDLCAIAGKPGLAGGFLAAKATRAQVSAELLKQRAAESGPEIASHILPDAGTNTEAKPSQSPVVKIAEAMAAAAKGGK